MNSPVSDFNTPALWLALAGAGVVAVITMFRYAPSKYRHGHPRLAWHPMSGLATAIIPCVFFYTVGRYLLYISQATLKTDWAIRLAIVVVLVLPLALYIRFIDRQLFHEGENSLGAFMAQVILL